MHLWWCKGVKLVFRDGLTFLVGLNESFSQIRSQILLIDSIPPINKVFSLFSQEEQQRNIASQISVASGGVDTVNNMAFFVKNNEVKKLGSLSSAGNKYHKKSRPFCTNCNFYRHTVEKCYKIMVLPDYKARHKPKNPSQSIGVNQVSTLTNFNEISYQHSGNVGKFLDNLNTGHYQHLMSLLSQHLSTTTSEIPQKDSTSNAYTTVICFSVYLNP